MLKIMFGNGLHSDCEMTKEEAEKLIARTCDSDSHWLEIKTPQQTVIYNKRLIAMMISK